MGLTVALHIYHNASLGHIKSQDDVVERSHVGRRDAAVVVHVGKDGEFVVEWHPAQQDVVEQSDIGCVDAAIEVHVAWHVAGLTPLAREP